MSNVGMSNERCQIQLSNDPMTHLPNDPLWNWSVGKWVTGSFDMWI